ncbi:hypothetical protein [Nisaea sp.]|uniref:hypothetical protein n=1 Tax=Nisaea sp. TaxID=2024842 RepID=UPI003B53009A
MSQSPKSQSPQGSYEVIHQPNKLKDLVGGPARMDEKLIEKAESALAEAIAGIDLSETAKESIEKLDAAVELLRQDGTEPAGPERTIYTVMHDLRAQGASFGYPMVEKIATSMNRYLELGEPGARGHNDIDAIRAHVDALKAVVATKMKGEVGAIGQQIVDGLYKISRTK